MLASTAGAGCAADPIAIDPARLPRIAVVDERFQSYNIEMVEVTGGAFWKPYASPSAQPELYAERPPIDLKNPRLRRFAAALSPAYLRVSGTWANATYFSDEDTGPPQPPAGFGGVLTRAQWRGVVDFAHAVGASIVTSFATSAGTRDGRGRWRSDEARRLLAFNRSIGGDVAAAELMNEPDLKSGASGGTDAKTFRRDFGTFRSLMRQMAGRTVLLGPGTIGTDAKAAAMFAAVADRIDAVSYHFYGAVSERCGGDRTQDAALSEPWLARTDEAFAVYRRLRDRLAPGKPIWLTETAEAACGGNRWAASFLDTFRYLDQLGRLATAGVAVVMHNTLAASDYGLLDERTLLPRPNYFGALLWRRLMGTTVLAAGVPIQNGLHLYAHCSRAGAGAVTLLAINNDRTETRDLIVQSASERYTLEADESGGLESEQVRLNGRVLATDDRDDLPPLAPTPTAAGAVRFAPATITFLSIPDAGNRNCR
ncbi:MAG TPA: hypothetical protein VMM15_13910 [Bradyrhizobium sp.]|nr:hypothetical protein [Bradyrhizobium sp.]